MNILSANTNGGIMLYTQKKNLEYLFCPQCDNQGVERHLSMKSQRILPNFGESLMMLKLF